MGLFINDVHKMNWISAKKFTNKSFPFVCKCHSATDRLLFPKGWTSFMNYPYLDWFDAVFAYIMEFPVDFMGTI